MYQKNFTKEDIFSYNLLKKRLFVIFSIILIILVLCFASSYFLFFQDSQNIFVKFLNKILQHISFQIKNTTWLSVVYTSFIGGLFFIFLPLEAIFISFLSSGKNPFLLIIFYLSGLLFAYTINYYIGLKFSSLAKNIITPKKFYKMKGILNRYGGWAVFCFNVFPLPSQPLATLLGVFRYTKSKFYLFFLLGQFVKYMVMIILYIYIW
jgi:membrane protein YqaA with SNARE-associated domain